VIGPPKDVESAALFRLLLEPSPCKSVQFRASVAPSVELSARAVPSSVWAESARLNNPSILVSASLFTTDGEQVFRSAREAGLLSQAEFRTLLDDVVAALDVVGPTIGRIDWRAWERVLVDGARKCGFESSNLAHCVDHYSTPIVAGITPRPDRYWGVPIGRLLDGHWMAFWAAREAHK